MKRYDSYSDARRTLAAKVRAAKVAGTALSAIAKNESLPGGVREATILDWIATAEEAGPLPRTAAAVVAARDFGARFEVLELRTGLSRAEVVALYRAGSGTDPRDTWTGKGRRDFADGRGDRSDLRAEENRTPAATVAALPTAEAAKVAEAVAAAEAARAALASPVAKPKGGRRPRAA